MIARDDQKITDQDQRITDLQGENSYLQEERSQFRKEKNQFALRIAQSQVMKAKVRPQRIPVPRGKEGRNQLSSQVRNKFLGNTNW